MGNIINIYIFWSLGVLIFAIIAYIIWDQRYRKNNGADVPPGFERTEEVTLDPSDGRVLRVYYNKRTGERFYHEE
jgi:hypothetical protein